MFPVRHVAALAALLLAAHTRADAQLPSVQQVYDNYATAVGGRDAWAKVTHRAEQGTANITFANITGSYNRYNSAPNKVRMIIDLGVGRVEQGSDGTTMWRAQPDGSVSRVGGAEAIDGAEANAVRAAFLDPSRFTNVAVVAQEVFDGVSCYKVAITTKGGHERYDFFEVATGLRRGQRVKWPDGLLTNIYRDYKAFDGKLMATVQIQGTAQGDVVLTINSVTFTPNDPKLFELPAGIAK
ncbi:hypothetical protein [Gemmatimonas groenlandica]|uniref:Outer membrane lipoprotein-sorting protein n=1 Tax=Gemmatimonas groenlandica TaxID=2732249 RepID=A0A6M4ITF6_9BACT|nr:hypothetical protein [Gemmatimonas groenlandica]QJR36766.1 hypothetical protein HKW67_15205 [Gemmatimonas groenlandica]